MFRRVAYACIANAFKSVHNAKPCKGNRPCTEKQHNYVIELTSVIEQVT